MPLQHDRREPLLATPRLAARGAVREPLLKGMAERDELLLNEQAEPV